MNKYGNQEEEKILQKLPFRILEVSSNQLIT